jgi:hypothetical protein
LPVDINKNKISSVSNISPYAKRCYEIEDRLHDEEELQKQTESEKEAKKEKRKKKCYN